jgi:adenylate cyclase
MKHWIPRVALSLALVGLFLARTAGLWEPRFLDALEHAAYDLALNLGLPGGVDERVVIIDLDERSLAVQGQWPWPRRRLARLVDNLFDHYGVRVLGLDVDFAEPGRRAGLDTLEALAQAAQPGWEWLAPRLPALRLALGADRRLAESLAGRPVVGAFYFTPDAELRRGLLPEPLFVLPPGEATPLVRGRGYVANVEGLARAMAAEGFIDNPLVDRDGAYRRVSLLQVHEGGVYESLALAVARLAVGDPAAWLETVPGSAEPEALRLGTLRIPMDARGGVLVPYRGSYRSFPYVSAADVLERGADPERLRGKMALLGSSAPGLSDLRATPVHQALPGAEVHANLISGILDGRIPVRPAYAPGVEAVLLVLIGVVMTALLPLVSVTASTLLLAALLALLVWGDQAAWQAGLDLPLAAPVLLALSLFVLHTTYGFFTETRRRRSLTRLFGQYVPATLVEEMSRRPGDFAVGGESREMTVLFADVRGFTSLSEGLEPRELTAIMNAYLSDMTRVIHAHRGTVDKYIGDAVMAFWGAPLPDPEHARHGLLAALTMQEEMERLRERFRRRGWPALHIGVGVNTGVMNVGNMGSEFRVAYTVLGDAVNLASRLEGLTKFYRVGCIVGEDTWRAVHDVVFRELDRVRVKGKERPVAIYQPIGLADRVTPERLEELERFHAALEDYRAQRWGEASQAFAALAARSPERHLHDLYLERIEHLSAAPPGPDWDGVYTYTSK